MGHIIPLVECAKKLVQYEFSVTIIIPTSEDPTPKAQSTLLEKLPESIQYTLLPPVTLPENISSGGRIFFTVALSLPFLRDTLESLSKTTNLVSLVVDPFGIVAFELASEFNISKTLFFTASAMMLLLCFHLPKLDETIKCEYRDLPEPIKLPGCVPVHGSNLVESLQDRTHIEYEGFLESVKLFNNADAILLNSFVDLEEGAIKALQEEEPTRPPVYPIGPLIQGGSSELGLQRSDCLKWLDEKPLGSVLFVSFGSGGTLSCHQFNELALGLEMSGQCFLWVIRSPNDESTDDAFFGSSDQNDPLSFLPEEFLERTKEQGLVVPFWAPQSEVLAHESTGGFITHCGWNSILESVFSGVSMIAWPLYAEQKMNAVMLTEGLKAGLKLKGGENGVVGREEIARVVKNLMEGQEGKRVRQKVRGLKDAAKKVLAEDGSSIRSLHDLELKWKNCKSV